jgi:hypothetical protein
LDEKILRVEEQRTSLRTALAEQNTSLCGLFSLPYELPYVKSE